jgi:type IV pili sensor histidine kinase/response regulator
MNKENPLMIIAEDEDELREMYVNAFSHGGFEVLEAKNGKEALEWLEKKPDSVDIIMSDIIMPKMDGFELLEKIRSMEKYRKLPVVMTTNLGSDSDKQTAMGLGANEYLIKVEWTPSKLVEKMKQIYSLKK